VHPKLDPASWPALNPRFRMFQGRFERAESDKRKRYIAGTLSTTAVDRHRTWFEAESLAAAISSTYTTRGLHYNHDLGAEIGKVDVIDATSDGTVIRAWVGEGFDFPYRSSPLAPVTMMSVDNLWKRMEQGLDSGLSIDVLADELPDPQGREGVKMLRTTDYIETSVCAIPSNRDTLASVMRSLAAGGDCPLCGRSCDHETRDAAVLEALAAVGGGNRDEQSDLLVTLAKEIRTWQSLR